MPTTRVTAPQAAALAYLAQCEYASCRSMARALYPGLSFRTAWRTAEGVVQRLRRAGLVETDPDHRGAWRLTDAGRAELSAIFTRRVAGVVADLRRTADQIERREVRRNLSDLLPDHLSMARDVMRDVLWCTPNLGLESLVAAAREADDAARAAAWVAAQQKDATDDLSRVPIEGGT